MHGRTHDRSMIGLHNQRRDDMFLLSLIASLLFFCLGAETKIDYDIINTGIKGGGCWYDDSHFVVIQGHQPALGQGFVVEGLYYLDPNQPKDLRRIDLSPIEPTLQKQIRDVTCQKQTILFDVMASDRKTTKLYSLKIGQQPELLADLRWAHPADISLKGQYVLGNKLTVQNGVWEEHADCDVKFAKPGLQILCWPKDTFGRWATPQFVVQEYLWRESVLVREHDGNIKRILNPVPPLKLSNGTELKQGYLLHDLENRNVQVIATQKDFYQMIGVSFTVDPSGTYLYSVCFKDGDHGDRHLTVGGRICRFRLDGKNQNWEEVASVQQSQKDPFSLHGLDVNERGDVLMAERGHRPAIGLWMYDAQSKMVGKLLQVVPPEELQGFRISPNGRWIGVTKQSSQLILLKRKGVTP